jgi:hypothetical protein
MEDITFEARYAMSLAKWIITSPSPWQKSIALSEQLKSLWTTHHENTSLWENVPRTKRIGYGCENLLERFITITNELELIKSRWQIQEHGRTIGEIDFLLKTPHGLEHWELGLKYYLYVPQRKQFIGSDGKDRLDLKLDKIENKQLPMGRHPQVLDYCQQSQLQPPTSRALIKGRLFFPKNNIPMNNPNTLQLNQHCDDGYWIRHHQLNDFIEATREKNMSYHILERYDWMSRDLKINNPRQNFPTGQNSSFQLVNLTKQQDHWTEHERWVVVPDDFPFYE